MIVHLAKPVKARDSVHVCIGRNGLGVVSNWQSDASQSLCGEAKPHLAGVQGSQVFILSTLFTLFTLFFPLAVFDFRFLHSIAFVCCRFSLDSTSMASQPPNPHVIQMSTLPPSNHTPAQQQDLKFRANHAYKYYGYQAFCEFQASGNDFFLLRRFGKLNTRVLLNLQYKISECEKRLAIFDEDCKNHPSDNVRSDSFKKDENAPQNSAQKLRAAELDNLAMLLKQYSKAIEKRLDEVAFN
jgi:hypothetical protein